jgi:hypothetical protein
VRVDSHRQKEFADGLFDAALQVFINQRRMAIKGRYGPLENLLAGRLIAGSGLFVKLHSLNR